VAKARLLLGGSFFGALLEAATMRSSPSDRTAARLPLATLCLSLLAVSAWLVSPSASWLEYHRGSIAGGQLWRLLTGHWTHFSADHLRWNVVAFAILGAALERNGRRRFLVTALGAALLLPPALWLVHPELIRYRGLSGIDSALYGALAIQLVRGRPDRRRWASPLAALVLLALLAKAGIELVFSTTLFVDAGDSGFAPVPLVHLVGGIWGVIAGRIDLSRVPRRSPRELLAGCRCPFEVGIGRRDGPAAGS
jgi:rhomboid family GlyGly-CTERM serine protease